MTNSMLYGGDLDPLDLPDFLPRKEFAVMYEVMKLSAKEVLGSGDNPLTRRLLGFRFIESPLSAPFTVPSGEKFEVLVPVSFTIRAWFLARLCLSHYGSDIRFRSTRPTSFTDPKKIFVPRRFAPIFKSYRNLGEQLDAADLLFRSVDVPDLVGPDALAVTAIAHYFVACHELIHIACCHHELVDGAIMGLAENDVNIACEIHADVLGVQHAFRISSYINEKFVEAPQWLFYTRFSYALLLVLSLFTGRNRFVGANDGTAYQHPVVRYEFLRMMIGMHLAKESIEDAVVWKKVENRTWPEFVFNLNQALLCSTSDEDVKNMPKDMVLLPFQSFDFGNVNVAAVDKRFFEAERLFCHFESILEEMGIAPSWPKGGTKDVQSIPVE